MISRTDPSADVGRRVPAPALLLGLAGLVPQILALTMLLFGNPEARFTALALAFAYAALILSFLGGMWWGLAAQARDEGPPPTWAWVAAVTPSLVALGSAIPWVVGAEWPGPSLVLLGVALAVSLLIDRRLAGLALAPRWWMALRFHLSIGLGGMTVAIGLLA